MDATRHPGKGYRASEEKKQAGCTARVGLVVGVRGNGAREADGSIDKDAQLIAPSLLHLGALVEPCMQIGRKRRFRAMTPDCALQGIQRDDVAGALPARAEVRIAQQPRGRKLLDVTV